MRTIRDGFQMFLDQSGHMFQVERNGEIVATLKGLDNHDSVTKQRYIGFLPGSDVKAGDWLINDQQERYVVTDTQTSYFQSRPSNLKCYCQTQAEYVKQKAQNSVVFNIGTATGSIIGTQGQATLSYAATIEQMHQKAEAEGGSDKAELEQIIALLEMVVNNQVPATKGLFSRFSAVMERHSWITNSVASAVIAWLTNPH